MSQVETITAKITSVSAETPEDATSRDRIGTDFTVTKDLPTTVEEAVEMWGAEVVFSRLRGAVVIDLQSFMRTRIKSKDFSEVELQVAVDEWGPSQRGPGVSMEQKAENLMSGMSDDALAELMERVNARKADNA